MNKLVPAVVSLTCLMMLGPPSASAAQQCAEVESAKAALRSNSNPQASARSQDVQSPRNQDTQSPRGQGVQSSRSQDVQSPRNNQDVQAPRSQDVQSPRNQDIQSPRNQDVQSPRGQQPAPQSAQQRQQATQLVSEAAAACDAGNPTVASQKAREAMALLRR
ncbi:MAG TPA: hypothetical protein VNU02_13750 [Candidatus Dormibacteraeota bacterium]|nr:hypothetical protein [Candidatus Dormibacteraeota bacterium]